MISMIRRAAAFLLAWLPAEAAFVRAWPPPGIPRGVWYGALAAQLGVRFSFAHFINAHGGDAVMRAYKERFQARAADPLKRWKLTDEDWRNREKNRDYEAAAEEMFERTSHALAPWDVIAAEQKRYARIAVLETLIARIEAGMHRWGIEVPKLEEFLEVE